MSKSNYILYDTQENTQTRYISFMGGSFRHDLVITITDNFYGKKLVINLQNNRVAIKRQDDLKEEGYIEFAFDVSKEEADELLQFLLAII